MAIAKKGSRKIVVDDESYRWLVRRKATMSQTEYGFGTLHLAVEHCDEPKCVLVIETNYPHPKDLDIEKNVIITPIVPSKVADWIRQALASGWEPKKQGAQFFLKLQD